MTNNPTQVEPEGLADELERLLAERDLEMFHATAFVNRHSIIRVLRSSTVNDELVEALDAELVRAAEQLEGHPDKSQRDFAIGVIWAVREAFHTRAALAKIGGGSNA